MRYIYQGEKPLNIGMNQAKRVARSADRRDRLAILFHMGAGSPKRDAHHGELVYRRHRYYAESTPTNELPRVNPVGHFPHASGCGPRETTRRIAQELRSFV